MLWFPATGSIYSRLESIAACGSSRHNLLVIEPEVENAAMESVRLRRTLRGLGVPADVVVVDEDLVRRRSVVAGTMVERALREGRVLVDA